VRVVCYAQHLTGVGHFVRMHTIAGALAERHDVHLVEGGRPVPRPRLGFEPSRIPLPLLQRDADGALTGADGGSADAILAARADQLTAALAELRPDVLLVDHYPFSKWELGDEIEHAAATARRANADARVVCSLRDIAPRTRHEAGSADGYDDEVLRRLRAFDAVLVHADPCLTTLREHFPAAERIAIPVRTTGIVVEPVVTGAFERPSAPWAVASSGGLDATAFLVAVVEAFAALVADGALPAMPLHVFAPSNASPADLEAIASAADGSAISVHDFTETFGAWVDGAALSISRGGYNTVAALLRSRVPAVVVPDPQVSDQGPRAAMLERIGAATVVDTDAAAPNGAALRTAMLRAHERGRPDITVELHGAAVTGQLLERLVAGEQPWAPERAA
jgi:predicted glycosyltransferase